MALSDATRLADFATGVGTDGTLGVHNINAAGIITAANVNVSGIITATTLKGTNIGDNSSTLYGDGSNLSNVISGVELKSDGNSVGTGVTQINFSGFGSVTAPVSGFSTVSVDRFLTIGVRSGAAVTFSIADSSFIVQARGGGDVTINL